MDGLYNEDLFERLSDKDFIDIMITRIRENLKSYFPGMGCKTAKVCGRVWGGQETARTFRFEITTERKEKTYMIFVKLCPVFQSANPAKMEYETIRLLYDKLPSYGDNYLVPRPLEYFPDLNSYAMESVGHRSFKPYLLRKNSILRNESSLIPLYKIIEGCANWLWMFHEISKEKKQSKFNFTEFMESLNQEYDYRMMDQFKFRKETLSKLNRVFNSLSYHSGSLSLPCAKWHWDFTPGHVFIDRNKISVIDILGLDNTPIYEDIGRFLASLSAINTFPFFPLFDYKRARGKLCDMFIEAYLSKTDYEEEAFMLYVNLYKLKYLIIWFFGQHFRVSAKLHPCLANAFANMRLVPIFERAILPTIDIIQKRLKV